MTLTDSLKYQCVRKRLRVNCRGWEAAYASGECHRRKQATRLGWHIGERTLGDWRPITDPGGSLENAPPPGINEPEATDCTPYRTGTHMHWDWAKDKGLTHPSRAAALCLPVFQSKLLQATLTANS